MANNQKLDISELDFDLIKGNLKTFLKNQDQFLDYDFEGSGMSALLDVLSYNTWTLQPCDPASCLMQKHWVMKLDQLEHQKQKSMFF